MNERSNNNNNKIKKKKEINKNAKIDYLRFQLLEGKKNDYIETVTVVTTLFEQSTELRFSTSICACTWTLYESTNLC